MTPVSERHIAANRQNAQHSPGPRTADGKARSSPNATTLGIFSSRLLLDGEYPRQLAELRAGLQRSLAPANLLEKLLVERIVAPTWKLQRLARAEQILYMKSAEWQRDELSDAMRKKLNLPPRDWFEINNATCWHSPEMSSDLAAALLLSKDNSHLDKLHKHEHRVEQSILHLLKELRELRKNRADDDGGDTDDFGQTEAPTDASETIEPHDAAPQPGAPPADQTKAGTAETSENPPPVVGPRREAFDAVPRTEPSDAKQMLMLLAAAAAGAGRAKSKPSPPAPAR